MEALQTQLTLVRSLSLHLPLSVCLSVSAQIKIQLESYANCNLIVSLIKASKQANVYGFQIFSSPSSLYVANKF